MRPSPPDFDLDVAALESKIGPRTAAVLVNSPNNPTGRIYPRQTLKKLANMLSAGGKEDRQDHLSHCG